MIRGYREGSLCNMQLGLAHMWCVAVDRHLERLRAEGSKPRLVLRDGHRWRIPPG